MKGKKAKYDEEFDEGFSPSDEEIRGINPILDENAPLMDRIEAFARLKYTKERIAAALGYSKAQAERFFIRIQDETTEEYVAYQRGIVMGDAQVDIGLSNKAMRGDNFCAAELLKRQEQQRISDLRKDLFNT